MEQKGKTGKYNLQKKKKPADGEDKDDRDRVIETKVKQDSLTHLLFFLVKLSSPFDLSFPLPLRLGKIEIFILGW